MRFDNKQWRGIIELAQKDIEPSWPGISVISPFGFEITGNRNHLERTLRKFYCYLGIPKKVKMDLTTITDEFSDRLMHHIKVRDTKFFDHLVLLIKNDSLIKFMEDGYLCGKNDKLLDIQARVTDDIMLDYTDAVLSSINGLLEGRGESSLFNTNAVKRSRTFQLYIIFEYLFGSYILPFTANEESLYSEALGRVNNLIQFFFTPSLMNTPPTKIEHILLHQLIFPRLTLILDAINQSSDKKHIECIDYHVSDKISVTLDLAAYMDVVYKIRRTYEEFV